jgi:predicted TIM-barrel fold metal-dependent hydrolase
MGKYEIISADGHLETPLNFSDRVPARHRDMAPHLETKDDGSQWWVADEWTHSNIANLYGGLRFDEFTASSAQTYFNSDGSPRPGTGDAVQRLREQDADGIDAEVLYPPVYTGAFIMGIAKKDPEAYLSIIRAYNDFVVEYCAVAPDRLIGNAMIPATTIDHAVNELRRVKEIGLTSVSISAWPNGTGTPADEDDRFWGLAQELNVKISPHGNFGQPITRAASGVTKELALIGGVQQPVAQTVGRLIFSGVFDRYPDLKIYFAETHAGWLPFILGGRGADELYLRWHKYYDVKLKKMPSQYYRDHCRFSFVSDRMGMELSDYIGTDLLMWGSDFPHAESTYPNTEKVLDELFSGISEEIRRKILVDNVVAFFELDPNAELTPTP